jgi:hypothetical protein
LGLLSCCLNLGLLDRAAGVSGDGEPPGAGLIPTKYAYAHRMQCGSRVSVISCGKTPNFARRPAFSSMTHDLPSETHALPSEWAQTTILRRGNNLCRHPVCKLDAVGICADSTLGKMSDFLQCTKYLQGVNLRGNVMRLQRSARLESKYRSPKVLPVHARTLFLWHPSLGSCMDARSPIDLIYIRAGSGRQAPNAIGGEVTG